ncbi:MICOS complex subunit MIC60-like [Amphibalanus amphitrite]|uniref:MICOS complex subunit MIC60-like n=1 Tax=Amphibalanus amphitrite TaxID=1232801 RepID=UPI001C909115|nr:MICOS complex subunit MIC60-like [Amphibalanus amphitrite]XP_043196761.1 MICOS complex subunit MIC60-like [Amphibalanus amphitrite]XP_043196762.1 MICOS complex subunit MIC60-like [Amphibalanus amphitrite]
MFRAANHVSRKVLSRVGSTNPALPGQLSSRSQTTAPKKKGSVSAVTVGAGVVSLALGGTVGYAWLDPAFRDTLEASVPYSKEALAAVLGERAPPPPPPEEVPSKLRIKKPAQKSEPKKEVASDSAPAKSTDKSEAVEPASDAKASPPAEAAEQPSEAAPAEAKSSAEEDAARAAEERARALEADHAVENLALENLLKELSQQAQMALDVAVDAQQRAASAVVGHVERVFRSLDDATEADWSEVKDSADIKAQICKKADELAENAREYLDKLSSVVEDSRRNKVTATNDQLTPVQEALAAAYYRLETAKNKVAAALSEARVMDEFRQLVDESRAKFQQEMSSIVPGVVLGEKNTKLSEEELNVLLVHAYRKVLYLQKELARMLTVEQQKFSSALERQRQELDAVLEERLSTELSRQHRQVELHHRQQLEALQTELENEMRQQLRRQAAAHSDHLQDVLSVQERELKLRFEMAHEDRLRDERQQYQSELAVVMGELKGLKDAITARADLDRAAHHAQEMWVSCQALKQAIRTGQLGAASWQQQLKPLRDEAAAIRQVAGESNRFVSAVLDNLPEVVLERGVYTEDALRERFCKVERLCKRVSMIDDEGGSLFKYALSYLQSLLVVDAFERLPSKEQRDEPINPTQLNTYEIIARARYCIDKDDLIQAVKYMGLLRGEPRLVASDWIRETRLLLEARQAADALLAHAAATGLQAL